MRLRYWVYSYKSCRSPSRTILTSLSRRPDERGRVHSSSCQPLPVMRAALHGLGRQRAIALRELPPQGLTRGLALGIGHGTEQRASLGLLFLGGGIQHVDDPMIPAPLLGRRRLLLSQGRPDTEVTIGGRTAPRRHPPGRQITQHGSPRLFGLSLSTLDRQPHSGRWSRRRSSPTGPPWGPPAPL